MCLARTAIAINVPILKYFRKIGKVFIDRDENIDFIDMPVYRKCELPGPDLLVPEGLDGVEICRPDRWIYSEDYAHAHADAQR